MVEETSRGRSIAWSIASLLIGLGVTTLVIYVLRAAPETEGTAGDPDRVYRVPVGDAPTKGPDDALVTIVEFSDFQCPHCRAAAATVKRLAEENDDLRLVFRHAPLTQVHPQAMGAAVASLAAHEQGRFWEFHDAMFEGQDELGLRGPAFIGDVARRLGLDMVRFEQAQDGPQLARKVRADRRLLLRLGQGAVPTFFVNGRVLRGNVPLDRFRPIVEEARAKARDLLDRGVPGDELYRALIGDGLGPELPETDAGAGAGSAPAAPPTLAPSDVEDAPSCGSDPADSGCD